MNYFSWFSDITRQLNFAPHKATRWPKPCSTGAAKPSDRGCISKSCLLKQVSNARYSLLNRRPRNLWISPTCIHFSSVQNMSWKNMAIPEELRQKAAFPSKDRLVWGRRMQLALQQVGQGGHVQVENPVRTQSWGMQPPFTLQFLEKSFNIRRGPCMDGMRSSRSERVLKSHRSQCTDPSARQLFESTCTRSYSHPPLEGKDACASSRCRF